MKTKVGVNEVNENAKMNVELQHSGVVRLNTGYETCFGVDQWDMLAELEKAIKEKNWSADYDGKFAGRVTIIVECLGEEMPGDA